MSFTNLTYAEFDSTVQNLPRDLGQAIAASASWSKQSSTSVLVTTTATTAAGGTTLTAASGAWTAAGIVVGTVVRIGDYGAADLEWRTVTAVGTTTITVAATSFTHNSGTNVYLGNEVFKATTARGADMIVDLCNSHYVVTATTGLSMAAYRAYSGAGLGTPTDVTSRYLWWKASANVASYVVHCIVSASQDHLFISVEGPRENETGADSATAGSCRNYFFMDDIVPYYSTPYDTVAAIYCGGQTVNTAAASSSLSMYGHQSRNPANTSSWEQTKLATLTHADNGIALSQHHQRLAPDGSFTMFPYVVFGDYSGQRGRLAHFWFAGFMNPDLLDTIIPSPPVGSKQTIGGDTYKLLAVNKTGTNISVWGQFGGLSNPSNSVNNIVVAVPST